MDDAFQMLGLPRNLVISDEAIRDAFREAGKQAHPDAGGGEGEFAALREALATVSSPSRRLRHWLELGGRPAEIRGTIDTDLMDLFSEVGGVTQQAESVIREREEAKSALGRAMLEGKIQRVRETVEAAISKVESSISAETGRFPGFASGAEIQPDAASQCARNLAFLEKWRTGLRGHYSRLV